MSRCLCLRHLRWALLIAFFLMASFASALKISTLCEFQYPAGYPRSNVVFDRAGNLYGTTGGLNGAASASPTQTPNGTVFELKPTAQGGWSCQQIYSFKGSPTDTSFPIAGLVLDHAGNLYGTGDSSGPDCVYRLSLSAGAKWTEKLIGGSGAGCDSAAALIFDKAGNLYGTTIECGDFPRGCVFELSPTGTGWNQTILYSFDYYDGQVPTAAVTLDKSGNLFGTAQAGGLYGYGEVFKLTQTSGQWSLTILYSFTGGSDGGAPIAGVTLDASGNVFGTTNGGGAGVGNGVAYELTPSADGSWTYSVIHTFGVDSGDGTEPRTDLKFDRSGSLYGTTWSGAVYKLTPFADGSWSESVVANPGGHIYGSVTFDYLGNIYGTTYDGGQSGRGTVFKITP